ncbi:MAG: amino acid permease, partial [Acidobacteria bacterium]
MGTCLIAMFLLYRNVTIISRITEYLWLGVMLAVVWVIVSGVTHFNSARAFDFPQGAFALSSDFFNGLGAAMLIAVYDYWGYYAVCFVGAEVRDPGRTIPRAILYSIFLVAIIYIVMNISILGVIPWQELNETTDSDARRYII